MTTSTDTPRTTNAPDITQAMVESFLSEREDTGVTGITPLRQGGWSSAWAYQVDGRREVIRFSHVADDFERDRLASRWASPLLPVPRFVALGDAFGGKYAITEWKDGVGFDSLDAGGVRRVMPSLFATMDAMLEIPPPGTGFGGWNTRGVGPYDSWVAFLRDVGTSDADGRLAGWRDALTASTIGIERFDRAYRALDDLAGDMPEIRQVVHNDLLNANVLVAGDQVNAVIDWGCGLNGDFLYDLAWFAFFWPWCPQWIDIDPVEEYRNHAWQAAPDLDGFDARLRCYQIHLGLGDVRYLAHLRNWPTADRLLQRVEEIAGLASGSAIQTSLP